MMQKSHSSLLKRALLELLPSKQSISEKGAEIRQAPASIGSEAGSTTGSVVL
jgi:hypothetical protein